MKILAYYQTHDKPRYSADEWYFGREAYEDFGQLIRDNLSGQTISKRIDLAEQPGGLVYEAQQLGIGTYDLLEALEGMCYNREAAEIDDSTYRVF